MFKRPDSLDHLEDLLVSLAITGGIVTDSPLALWLESIGVAHYQDGYLQTSEEWVVNAFPAKNQRDLLRKVALRDASYRMHLDLLLAQVLSRMARDNRMGKVEEYLLGPLSSFAPRLAYVLNRKRAAGFDDTDWVTIEKSFIGLENVKTFHRWDRSLFGDILGGAEQRFPIVLDLYGPVAGNQVYFRPKSFSMSADEVDLLADIVAAGSDRQAVYLKDNEERALDSILSRGCLPIRKWPGRSPEALRVACISPIVLIGVKGRKVSGRTHCDVPGELPAALVTNRLVVSSPDNIPPSLWVVLETNSRAGAFPSTNIYEPAAYEYAQFDPNDSRKILDLSEHRMFGFLIQFFMVEAFGRELGDECLNVLPIGSPDQPERIDVYYRPEKATASYALLGHVDEVLTYVASRMNLFTIPSLWEKCRYGMWTQALLVLKQARVISFRAGEYLLNEKFFDVCHSRTFMQEILRKGKDLRDRIHSVLAEKYEEHNMIPKRSIDRYEQEVNSKTHKAVFVD